MSNQAPTRVNIQFSIELDELPREVSRLLEHSAEHVTAAAQGFNTIKSASEILSVSTWNQLDTLRRSLSKADLVLDDLQKILGGYLQMQSEQFSVPQSPQPQSEEAGTPGDTMVDRGIIGDHPDKNHRKSARQQKITEAQNQLSAFMEQMHKMQNNPATAISEEEEQAMKTMKNRAQRAMETGNEESSGSKEPSV